MKNFSSNLDSFIKLVSNNKIWAFAASIFLFFFWFTINFYISAPNEWIELNKRRLDLDNIELEGKVVDSIYENVLNGLAKSKDAHDVYGKFTKQVKDEQKIPSHKDLLAYYLDLVSINNDISRAIGNLDSLSSNDPEIDGYAKEFSTDLKTYQTLFNEMESVLQSLLNGENEQQTLDKILSEAQALIQTPIYLEKTMNRMVGFVSATKKKLQDEATNLSTLQNDTELFFRKTYFGIFGIVYMLCFAFFGVRKWYYYNKSKRRTRNNRSRRA